MTSELVPLPDEAWETKERLWRQGAVICDHWEYTSGRGGTVQSGPGASSWWMEATPPFSVLPEDEHRDGIHPLCVVSVPSIGLFATGGDLRIEDAVHRALCELWHSYVDWDGYQNIEEGRALRQELVQRFRVYEFVPPPPLPDAHRPSW